MFKVKQNNLGVIKETLEEDSSVWELPNVEKEATQEEQDKTNAFGKPRGWRYEPPPEPEPEPVPLTAEEIEEIRQAAYDEGFSEGKEEGFAKGYEEGKAQGYDAGHESGQSQGLTEGLEQGQAQIEELSLKWQAQIEQLHQPLNSVEKNIEQQLLHLVVQLAEAVVHQEVKTNPDILMSAISEGIKALPSSEAQTEIYLHPEDIHLVEAQFGENYIQESAWRLLPAPQLQPGSCQIENSTSSIDLSMKTRLKQVMESFLQEALHK
ncbi:flagellar assembly protein FliH [Thalassotalea euphylliae]|uniref:flagellar assembly protein FliH n=1 Tax=Thalassotalea euphylliae TaxID=1655234 RepID=UPI00363752E0